MSEINWDKLELRAIEQVEANAEYFVDTICSAICEGTVIYDNYWEGYIENAETSLHILMKMIVYNEARNIVPKARQHLATFSPYLLQMNMMNKSFPKGVEQMLLNLISSCNRTVLRFSDDIMTNVFSGDSGDSGVKK